MNKTVKYKMNKLSAERMIKLEDYLKEEIIKNEKSFMSVISKFPFEESLYLMYAYKMPLESIIDAVNWYDVNKCNPVAFVESLCETYYVTREDVIKRVQSVRRIMAYKENVKTKTKKR